MKAESDATDVGLRVAVLGAGSWGTALALHLASLGHEVRLWSRRLEHVEQMRATGENAQYLPGHRFPANLSVHHDMAVTLEGAKLLVCAIPSHAFRPIARQLAALLPSAASSQLITLIASKGVEVDSLATMARVADEEFGQGLGISTAVLGGPSFAAEVAAGLPTAVVVASHSAAAGGHVQRILSGRSFRAYVSDDVVGVELGGAFKNVIALAAGINDGAGLGQNARAGLITRGLAETRRLAIAMGANPATLAGLAGVGDLILTCTGGLSRNRRVGIALGEGKRLDEVLGALGMVAEGVRNTRSVFQLAQRERVEMPIVEVMHGILYSGLTVPEAVDQLMHRALKAEGV